ncbi:MAG: DUF2721 domain-containing protein [Pseudomonadota bacterium]|nr:DUF2721 domain-containing protein [Pseudomonadota bacterium]
MQDAGAFADIGHVIQLSVAPVFLLVAIGSMLNVMTARLGRVVDRARKIEEDIGRDKTAELRALRVDELQALDRRMIYSNSAINFCAISALLVAFVVVLLFVGDLAAFDLSLAVALLFVLAMLGIIGGLCMFLLEITVSMRTVRVRAEFLKSK